MGLRMHRQVGALGKVLSQQAIGVLVRAALPRALRIAKIDVDFGRQRKAAMIRKFLAPVPGQRFIQFALIGRNQPCCRRQFIKVKRSAPGDRQGVDGASPSR